MNKSEFASRVCLVSFILILIFPGAYSQEYSKHSIRTGVGVAMNQGDEEIGVGFVSSVGYQMNFWKDRARFNPYILNGGFMPFGITDTRDQFYRLTKLGSNVSLDIFKVRAVSLFIGGGAFVSYSRGLLGTGGWPEEGNNRSEYFINGYAGGNITGGIRINPENHKFAYELSPLNIYIGNNNYFLGYMNFSLEIKL